MESTVEIINNPYTQRVRILIDGKAVSVYSNLEKYMDEPFSYWCDRILEELYEECNESCYRLHFCSRQEETAVMERLAADSPYCTCFSTGKLVRSASLTERMKELNALIKKNHITGYQSSVYRVMFVLPENMRCYERDLREMEVRNVYCRIEPDVVYYQDFQKMRPKTDVLVFFVQDKSTEEYMRRYGIQEGFGIRIGEKKSFEKKAGGVFLYHQ